jgi:hypothetical protein
MYEGLEFRHLTAFVAVVEECSFVKAAERIKISQPAFSTQIKQLEDGLGVSLLIRSQTGTSVTDYGRHFLQLARQILHMRDHAVRTTSVDKSGTGLRLRFGYSPFTDHTLMEEARTGYGVLVPGGHIQTSSECSAELTRMVADGRPEEANTWSCTEFFPRLARARSGAPQKVWFPCWARSAMNCFGVWLFGGALRGGRLPAEVGGGERKAFADREATPSLKKINV